MSPARVACAAVVLAAALSSAVAAAPAESPAGTPTNLGRVTGQVVDAAGNPVEFAKVVLPALPRTTQADELGRFALTGVPPGTYEIRAERVGQGIARQTVAVAAGATASVTLVFESGKAIDLGGVEVKGERIDRNDSGTSHTIPRDKILDTPVDRVADLLKLTAGVVAIADQISVRGSRPDEVKTRVNGVEVTDPLFSRTASVASLAVDNLELRTGGFDAEYGGALSGIVEIDLREGADSLAGDVRWDTDRFGDPTKTFDRYDRFTVGFGGPTPVPHLTYFATYEGTYSDTYLRTSLTQPSRTVFDFVRLGNRQQNQVNLSLKLAWTPVARDKFTLELAHNRGIHTPYEHMWSRQGYVQVRQDTVATAQGGTQIVPVYGGWSATPLDSTYQPMNLPDHTPTLDDRFRQITAGWTRQISGTDVWTTRLALVRFDSYLSVGGRSPWEYETQSPFYWAGNVQAGTENNPYFATHGDFPRWFSRSSSSYTLKSDLATRRWQKHLAKTGIEARYHRLQNLSLTLPNLEVNGLPGASRSDFVNFHPEASAYVQDRWEHEGLVLNAGVRWDLFTPGDQISESDLPSGRRFKHQFSPRLGVAFPISVRDVLSFHYGWTYQTPARDYIFENRALGTTVDVRGNPDLDPETNVAYQVALRHLFSRDISGQFAVFFRDIYGLITGREEKDAYGNVVRAYANGDYASARGFEASVIKRFSHKFSADLSYSMSIATGVASDPAQALQFFNGGRLFLPISERPLVWDQTHTLSLNALVREPGRWGMRMVWTYGSGLPYTPTFRNDRRPDPALENSRRLPPTSSLTLTGDKYFKLWGQDMTVFVDARNLLDNANLVNPSPNVASFLNPYLNAGGNDYLAYYSETGRAGGAYLQDVNGDQTLDWVPVHDPRVLEEGRRVRLGLALRF